MRRFITNFVEYHHDPDKIFCFSKKRPQSGGDRNGDRRRNLGESTD